MVLLALTFNLIHLVFHQAVIHFGEYDERVTDAKRWAYSLGWAPVLGLPLIALRSGNIPLLSVSITVLTALLAGQVIAWIRRSIPLLFPQGLEEPPAAATRLSLFILTLLSLITTSICQLNQSIN